MPSRLPVERERALAAFSRSKKSVGRGARRRPLRRLDLTTTAPPGPAVAQSGPAHSARGRRRAERSHQGMAVLPRAPIAARRASTRLPDPGHGRPNSAASPRVAAPRGPARSGPPRTRGRGGVRRRVELEHAGTRSCPRRAAGTPPEPSAQGRRRQLPPQLVARAARAHEAARSPRGQRVQLSKRAPAGRRPPRPAVAERVVDGPVSAIAPLAAQRCTGSRPWRQVTSRDPGTSQRRHLSRRLASPVPLDRTGASWYPRTECRARGAAAQRVRACRSSSSVSRHGEVDDDWLELCDVVVTAATGAGRHRENVERFPLAAAPGAAAAGQPGRSVDEAWSPSPRSTPSAVGAGVLGLAGSTRRHEPDDGRACG